MSPLARLIRSQDGVVTRQQLFALSLDDGFIRTQLTSMRWVALAPGVYLVGAGPGSLNQRARAAVLASGPESMVTGSAGMTLHGVRIQWSETQVSTLIPHDRRRVSNTLVRSIRCVVLPRPVIRYDIPVASVARATIDACRGVSGLTEVRARLAAPVQQRHCSLEGLFAAALEVGRMSPVLRAGLAEIADGVRSVPEGVVRKLVLASTLPAPLWNPRLFTNSGQFIACPDAYWGEAGLAVEVESREFHFEVAAWNRTLARRSLAQPADPAGMFPHPQ